MGAVASGGLAYEEMLAGRVRDRLWDMAGVTDKKMFGGRAFLPHGDMTVGVHGDDLIARISPDGMEGALAQPGYAPWT